MTIRQNIQPFSFKALCLSARSERDASNRYDYYQEPGTFAPTARIPIMNREPLMLVRVYVIPYDDLGYYSLGIIRTLTDCRYNQLGYGMVDKALTVFCENKSGIRLGIAHAGTSHKGMYKAILKDIIYPICELRKRSES